MVGEKIDFSLAALDFNLPVHFFHREVWHFLFQVLQGDPVAQTIEIHGNGAAHGVGGAVGVGGFDEKEAGDGTFLVVHGGLPGNPAGGFPGCISLFNGFREAVRFHFHRCIDTGPFQKVRIPGNGDVHVHGFFLPAFGGKGGVRGKRGRKSRPQGPLGGSAAGKGCQKGHGQQHFFPFHRNSSFARNRECYTFPMGTENTPSEKGVRSSCWYRA